MEPHFDVLPPGQPLAPRKKGRGGVFATLAVLALKYKTVLSMALSIWVYSFAWGWSFAIGLVLLIFAHEMGHVFAASLKGIPVTAPLFIPFLGAGVLTSNKDAWTEAFVGYGGPLAGTLAGIVVWWFALKLNLPWLMAIARANFILNLFNLIPLPPLDGGRICAAVSTRFWLLGVILYGAALVFFQPPGIFYLASVLVLVLAWPRLQLTFLQPATPEMKAYYATNLFRRITMAALYLGLIAALLLGCWDANEHLRSGGPP